MDVCTDNINNTRGNTLLNDKNNIKMKKIKINIEVEPPHKFFECTSEQQNEWINFEMGSIPQISLDNPLHDYSLLEDTEVIYWSQPNE